MPITERQRQMRRKAIGASDVPAILGLDTYRNALDVWMSKVYEMDEGKSSEAAQIGNFLESGVLDLAERKLGRITPRNQRKRAAACKHLVVSLDGRVQSTGVPVQAKTSGITGPTFEEWDPIPDRVIVQVTAEMIATDSDHGWVAALVGGRGFILKRVARSDKLVALITHSIQSFWRDHVIPKIEPPSESPAREETHKAIRRVPKSVARTGQSVVAPWIESKRLSTEAGKKAKGFAALIFRAMGDCECLVDGDGRTVTFLQTNVKGFTVEPRTQRTLREAKEIPNVSIE